MSLVGQLADLRLDDILKIIHLSRKSGNLSVRGQDQEWTITFWQGEVIRLSSEHVVPVLIAGLQEEGLLAPGVIDEAREALAENAGSGPEAMLGGRYGISRDDMEHLSRLLAERCLAGLSSWDDGNFCFELWDEEDTPPPAAKVPYLSFGGGVPAHGPASPDTGKADLSRAGSPGREQGVQEPCNTVGGVQETFSGPVWIVDDDPCLREALGAYLEGRGISVVLFETAADFWIALKKACLDGVDPVAVVDLVMPRLNGDGMLGGVELLEKVRDVYPHLRVLPLSDHRCSEAEAKAREMGVAEIHSKPYQPDMQQEIGKNAIEALGRALFSALRSPAIPIAKGTGGDDGEAVSSAGASRGRGEESRFRNSPGLHLLRGMLEELNNPALGGGIILLVLRFASEVMNRAVIFSVKDEHIVGIGQFGVSLPAGDTDAAIRGIAIPRNGDSILGRLMRCPRPMRTRYDGGEWDRFLCRALGGDVPEEIFLGPIFSEGRVVAILYGDNLPDHSRVNNTEALEIFLSQAGLAMEKALWEGRLQGSHSL
jgi:CheY-like chemotaxis protein